MPGRHVTGADGRIVLSPEIRRRPCQHERIHREGSLGYFCNECGVPIDNLEDYLDG